MWIGQDQEVPSSFTTDINFVTNVRPLSRKFTLGIRLAGFHTSDNATVI